ncbi:MAG: hypothetical protein ABSA94_19790 [Acidobacteriaceae bacterium]|jgi:hypothetical protein
MNKIRKRLINFRVTDEEFERIKTASDRQGARCVSEFARTVMMGGGKAYAESNFDGSSDVNDKLLTVERRLAMLELYVSRLSDAVSSAQNGRIRSES